MEWRAGRILGGSSHGQRLEGEGDTYLTVFLSFCFPAELVSAWVKKSKGQGRESRQFFIVLL